MSVGPAPLPRVGLRRPRISAAWRQPLAIVGVVLAVLWIAVAILAPLLAPHDPLAQDDVIASLESVFRAAGG